MQKLQFIHVISEMGAGKLGTKQGVLQLWEKFQENHSTQCYSAFDLPTQTEPSNTEAKYIEDLTVFFQETLVPNLTDIFQSSRFPVILSGDHANAMATLSALCNVYPDKRIGVLWIDAHCDLHSPYTTPSGNLHGMTLAAVSRQDNLSSAIRGLSDHTQRYWNALKQLAPSSQGIFPQDIFFLGLRSYELPEQNLMTAFNIPSISAVEARKRGFSQVFEQIKQHFSAVELLYVSFDVDALDASLIPTTGTPEAEGFTYAEIQEILANVLHLPQLHAFEITEFNPTLSADKRYLENIYALLEYATDQINSRV